MSCVMILLIETFEFRWYLTFFLYLGMLNVYKLGLLLAKAVQLLTKRFENQVREKGTNSLSMMIEI